MLEKLIKLTLFCCVILGLSACGGGSSGSSPVVVDPPPVDTNNPPVIEVAQVSQVIEVGTDSVTLSIAASDDNGVSSIAWSQTSGLSVELVNAHTEQASFSVPRVSITGGEQQLSFKVVVTDTDGATAQSDLEVLLKPNNELPVIVAANPTQSADPGEQVMLEISATDDSQISQIQWQQVSGTAVSIENADSTTASFMAPAYSDNSENNTLAFTVTVIDDDGDSAEQSLTVNILAENILPTVEVNGPSEVSLFDEVVVTVNASDSDGEIVSYHWELTSVGNSVDFTQNESGKLTFVTPYSTSTRSYEFQVTVTDNSGGQTQADYAVVVRVWPLQVRITHISETQVVSGERVWFDWQVINSFEIKEVRLNRVDTGEHVPLDILSYKNASFVSAYIQDQTKNIEYVFTVEDVTGLTAETRFSLITDPFTSLFAPERVLLDLRNDAEGLPFYSFDFMNLFGNDVVVRDRQVIPDIHRLKFENGALVVDESFDSSPWSNTTFPIFDWINTDFDQDGINDVIVAGEVVGSISHKFGVMLADNEGNLSTFRDLGEFESQDHMRFNGYVDVNGDGHKDIRMIPRANPDREFFLAYQEDTQIFELMEDSDSIQPDGSPETVLAYKDFADVNNDGKNEAIGYTNIQTPCDVLAFCGNLQMSMINEQGQYQSWTIFDYDNLTPNSIVVRDVNLDGADDLLFNGYERVSVDEPIEAPYWYRYGQDGVMHKSYFWPVPKYYGDIEANGKPYLFDVDGGGSIRTYKFDELSGQPERDTTHIITHGTKHHLTIVDIDKDGDLDLVYTDDEQDPRYIFWIENLHL